MKSTHIIALVALLSLFGCGSPVGPRGGGVETAPQVRPTFLYANDRGQLTTLNTRYTDEDTLFVVERFSNIGPNFVSYGLVDDKYRRAYDWNKFRSDELAPRAVAVLRRVNRIDPSYLHFWTREFVSVDMNKRIGKLSFYSFMNKGVIPMEHTNFRLGERTVSMIDHRNFMALFTDEWEFRGQRPRPADYPYTGYETYLVRFDFESPTPYLGQVVTSFSTNDPRVDVDKDKPIDPSWGSLYSTANGEFYVIWHPYFATLPSSPYIIRTDGTLAFDPKQVRTSWTDRFLGANLIDMEPHPSRDSLFVISDMWSLHQNVVLAELPVLPDQRFTELKKLPYSTILAGNTNTSVSHSDVWRKKNWFNTFNRDGSRIAIAQALPGRQPSVTVWDVDADSSATYLINRPGDIQFNAIGRPAFDFKNEKMLYFIAADTTNTNEAFFFWIDSSRRSTYATRIPWNRIRYSRTNAAAELLRIPHDLVGR